jgi:hypothetical protein
MKVAILDVRQGAGRVAENSYTVAYRNLVVLRDYFGADLFINASDISVNNDYDIIICGFGSTSCEKDKSTDFLVRNHNAKVYWLVGEYEQSTFAPLFYSQRKFEIIKNFEHALRNKNCIGQHFVNINALLAKQPNKPNIKKYGAVYYGRWRPDRIDYFRQYLSSDMHLSTHSKNIKMFHHNGCNPKLIRPMTWDAGRETLNLFAASLYIEDKFTHQNYNCLANRYYEALFCNTVPLFDASCLSTIKKSKIDKYDDYIVRSPKDIAARLVVINNGKLCVPAGWQESALIERQEVLTKIQSIFEAS